jgi:hypothetical protein
MYLVLSNPDCRRRPLIRSITRMSQMIIANRLEDGRVVFMTGDAAWSDSINAGCLIFDEPESARLLDIALESERNCEVIDPYLIDVCEENGVRTPTSYREQIRATGPTVQTGGV